jgi:hypothetical protein
MLQSGQMPNSNGHANSTEQNVATGMNFNK